MRFVFKEVSHLPRLAWCACMEGGKGEVIVYHGPWVETRDTFFCEGVWNGLFQDGGFDTATLMMGSGGKLRDDSVVFATPCHTLERLFSLRVGNKLLISSSLPFLLSLSGQRLDRHYPHYHADFATISDGYKRYKKSIPTERGDHIELHYFANIRVDPSLVLVREEKVLPAGFENFEDYEAFLVDGVHAIGANATDSMRKIQYKAITSISSGYDSPTCAVLAREIGCKEALTITDPRDMSGRGGADDSDDGSEIAKYLGMHPVPFERAAYLRRTEFSEAEFLVAGTLGGDIFMSAFEEHLDATLFFVGHHGDHVWSKRPKTLSSEIVRHGTSGDNLGEFRSRVGFVLVPLAFFGCTHIDDLVKISASEDMARWSNGSWYDRPIARRIVETAGVPRSLFGNKKKAVALIISQDLEKSLTGPSYEDYMTFVGKGEPLSVRLQRALHNFVYEIKKGKWNKWYMWYMRINNRLKSRRYFLGLHLPNISSRYDVPLGKEYQLLVWASEKLLARYRVD